MRVITDKAADALDLAIELVTLGEYGLEYPEGSIPEPTAHRDTRTAMAGCDSRHRGVAHASGRAPATTPPRRRRPSENTPRRPARPTSPADIIRTPRIRPDWSRA